MANPKPLSLSMLSIAAILARESPPNYVQGSSGDVFTIATVIAHTLTGRRLKCLGPAEPSIVIQKPILSYH